ncbi:MAG: Calcineurin-like phosphoesterase [Clostridiales bacterium]|jgi:predicted phosphodiesterase|nr:Calcineurin-like phosphoesterase [Clostridiales bacterium]
MAIMGRNRFEKAFYFYIFILAISLIDIIFYWSMRSIWFFIDKRVESILGVDLPMAWIIFGLFCLTFIYIFTNLISFKMKQRNYIHRPRIVNIILPVLLIIIFTAADYVLYSMLDSSSNIVLRNMVEMLPYLLLIFAVIFFIIFYPRLGISKSNIFKFLTAALVTILIALYALNFGAVKITSGPYIQYVDNSNVAIIWTTNKKSTGYVEYGRNEGNLKKINPSTNGIVDANTKIHKVIIPANNLNESVYRVGSTKISDYFQNNVEYGNTSVSDFKKFTNYQNKDNITFYVLNDVHENRDIYKRFLSGDDYDFVVLNGDTVNSFDNKDIIINELLKPLSEYTKGIKPVYIVRGNHETRGAAQVELMKYTAFPGSSYYYTFKIGPVYAVVLDSGEDKLDSHEEYGGLANFKEYREKETAWLEKLSETEEYKNAIFKIAFIHIPLNSYDADNSYLKDYQEKWTNILNNMKIDMVFSGHTHAPEVINADNTRFSFPTYIGGGSYGNENNYAAIKVNVAKDSMNVQYITYDGRITGEYNGTVKH